MDECPEQTRLRDEVHAILAGIDRINREQMEALGAVDDERLMALDKPTGNADGTEGAFLRSAVSASQRARLLADFPLPLFGLAGATRISPALEAWR